MNDEQKYIFLQENFKYIKHELKLVESRLQSNNLLKSVDDFETSLRVMNFFKNDNINYIGDLVQFSEGEVLRTPNFGRKSLNEVKEILNKMSLYLGMKNISTEVYNKWKRKKMLDLIINGKPE